MLAMSAWLESIALVNQRVLDATVGDGDDDDKIVLNGTKRALSSTTGLNVKFPFAVSKRGVGKERFLKGTGVFAYVLFPLNVTFSIGEGRTNVVTFIVKKDGRKVA